MKFVISVFVLIFSITSANCDFLKHHSRKPILEITSDFRGSWWIYGQVLDFRLYDDGTAEYDEYPMQSSPNGTIMVKAAKTTRQIKINEAESKEILDILASNKLTKTEEEISPEKSCIDAFIDTKINFSLDNAAKQIVIKSHCSRLADSQSTSFYYKNFPLKINNFFQKIRKIKDKESSGKFYN